ncbi:MAG TPA: hypothetical protein VHQ22_23575 [Terriglobales bacterium]|nr:hypothetical protein [Terriglobales bacterium]
MGPIFSDVNGFKRVVAGHIGKSAMDRQTGSEFGRKSLYEGSSYEFASFPFMHSRK